MSLLTLVLFATIAAMWVRPYFLAPPQWRDYSPKELRLQRDQGRIVAVYFRADWWSGFDHLQTELLDDESISVIRKNNVVLMVANIEQDDSDAIAELEQASGMKLIPPVVIYSPNETSALGKNSINASAFTETLSRLAK